MPVHKLNSDLLDQYLVYIKDGCTKEDAAGLIGVDRTTIWNYCKKHPDYAQQVQAAELRCKKELLGCIVKQAEKDWRAGAFLLERRHFREYGRRNPNDYTPEEFMLFVVKLTEIVRKYVPQDTKLQLSEEIKTLIEEIKKQKEH